MDYPSIYVGAEMRPVRPQHKLAQNLNLKTGAHKKGNSNDTTKNSDDPTGLTKGRGHATICSFVDNVAKAFFTNDLAEPARYLRLEEFANTPSLPTVICGTLFDGSDVILEQLTIGGEM
jgi:hypothetical protein